MYRSNHTYFEYFIIYFLEGKIIIIHTIHYKIKHEQYYETPSTDITINNCAV